VAFFETQGIHAVHWSTVGKASAPDTEIMDFAVANGFIVFTHDLDFGALLAAGRTRGPSVIHVGDAILSPNQ
jgi:predicted nuclease of predicted toxin-antitoxin system